MSSDNPNIPKLGITRRSVLKGGAAAAGVAAGSGVLSGFPTIWAQNIKDVTLRHVGQSYSTIIQIGEQATKDLGFKVEMGLTDHAGFLNRVAGQPRTIDVADFEIWQRIQTVPRGLYQGIDVNRIKHWDKMTTIYTQGTFNGKPVSRVGVSPVEVMYLPSKDGKTFSDTPTQWATMMPGVFNADTLGIRPDLIGRPIESWAELINPEFSGKAAIQTTPAIGIMDAAMAFQASGEVKYGDMGNMTKTEIDRTIKLLIDLKRDGHWRALWANFDQSVNLMASGEVVIQSMWSPAVTAVRSQGVEVFYVPLKEGYRGWGNGLSLMFHLEGLKLDAAYEYLNWYNSGWMGGFIAKQGYYLGVRETAKAFLTDNEWGYWYAGKKATDTIVSPFGDAMEQAGHGRDGGSFEERFSQIAVWNTFMDEARYMNRKWNEFITA